MTQKGDTVLDVYRTKPEMLALITQEFGFHNFRGSGRKQLSEDLRYGCETDSWGTRVNSWYFTRYQFGQLMNKDDWRVAGILYRLYKQGWLNRRRYKGVYFYWLSKKADKYYRENNGNWFNPDGWLIQRWVDDNHEIVEYENNKYELVEVEN